MDISNSQNPSILSFVSLYFVLSVLTLSWTTYIVLYRLFWSPVAGIPGPKLAAITFWYEFYYDVIKVGQYTWKIKSLHEKYGPIIRINPEEVHIDDPDFYDQVYVSAATRKTDKWKFSSQMFGIPHAIIETRPHALHRRRRAMFSNNFSTTAVHRLTPLLRNKVDKLLERFNQAERTKEPLSLTDAYSALTTDIITAYTFADSWNHLDADDFAPDFANFVKKASPPTHMIKQFPWVVPIIYNLPSFIALRVFPEQYVITVMDETYARQIAQLREKKATTGDAIEDAKTQDSTSTTVHSIFGAMLDADVPESEKSTKRLTQDAQALVIAGTLTTSHALEAITYHVLANPNILTRLRDELWSATNAAMKADPSARLLFPKDLPMKALESLEYTTAVIREGLRTSYGVPQRLPRISPEAPIQYKDFYIPPGVPVSMSSLIMHERTDIFPDPLVFKPERWLPLDIVGRKLNNYLVPFSRGSRQCVGMNLAFAELYLTIAAVFGGSLQLEMYDTNYDRDIKTVVDAFNPLPSSESKGLRVIFHKDN